MSTSAMRPQKNSSPVRPSAGQAEAQDVDDEDARQAAEDVDVDDGEATQRREQGPLEAAHDGQQRAPG